MGELRPKRSKNRSKKQKNVIYDIDGKMKILSKNAIYILFIFILIFNFYGCGKKSMPIPENTNENSQK